MLVIDMLDLSLQSAPIVVVSNTQVAQRTKDYAIGICAPIENKVESKTSAVNDVAPIGPAFKYLKNIERKEIDWSVTESATVTILHGPAHGALSPYGKTGSFSYVSSDNQYSGPDSATILVEMGEYKIKAIYHFNLMQNVPGSGDQGTAYDNKSICPNGYIWKLSDQPG